MAAAKIGFFYAQLNSWCQLGAIFYWSWIKCDCIALESWLMYNYCHYFFLPPSIFSLPWPYYFGCLNWWGLAESTYLPDHLLWASWKVVFACPLNHIIMWDDNKLCTLLFQVSFYPQRKFFLSKCTYALWEDKLRHFLMLSSLCSRQIDRWGPRLVQTEFIHWKLIMQKKLTNF